jgi:diguanylate cyclase (GGDEF)-like protein/PAS domain S-box-containing protein
MSLHTDLTPARDLPPTPDVTIHDVLLAGAVRSVFQPIVDLDSGAVVAYEALARGPRGALENPNDLFAAARASGVLAELDAACRTAAFRAAVAQGLSDPMTVFVNVEPEVLDDAPVDDLLAIAQQAPGGLRIVLEITERALAARPAELLRTVQRVRELGWGVALDDVGADAASLAFMPLLRPDVVKLDLSLVQMRPSPAVAEIMNAVNAYSEKTGALVLAEGIETPEHLVVARALGARLGQGWLFGRPSPTPAQALPVQRLKLPLAQAGLGRELVSPFSCLPADAVLRTSPKRLLVELSKHLEREAMRLGETCVVAATFQHARHFTPSTVQRYRDLADRTGFVAALGEDLPVEPVPGVRGASLDLDDPLRGEWDIIVLAPHFATALLARDLGDDGPEMERRFEYALTYSRPHVISAAHALLARVVPRSPSHDAARPGSVVERTADLPDPLHPVAGGTVPLLDGGPLLHRALASTTCGVTIVDLTAPDQPLMYANAAFEALAGFDGSQMIGRNCRFLQGPDTDPGAVARVRSAIAAGREHRETLLNYRGPDRVPWWNEICLSPVTDEDGRVVQYIGIQNDVTTRMDAERALVLERDRARSYLTRIEELAYTDPLTGLMNRRRLEERVEAQLWEARASGTALALLFMDLDGFKGVNDVLGHRGGDELLQVLAQRLRTWVRRSDLLARLGGDEFLVAVVGLDVADAAERAHQLAAELTQVVAAPVRLGTDTVQVSVSVGVSTYPADGQEFGQLMHVADRRMYDLKHPAEG